MVSVIYLHVLFLVLPFLSDAYTIPRYYADTYVCSNCLSKVSQIQPEFYNVDDSMGSRRQKLFHIDLSSQPISRFRPLRGEGDHPLLAQAHQSQRGSVKVSIHISITVFQSSSQPTASNASLNHYISILISCPNPAYKYAYI